MLDANKNKKGISITISKQKITYHFSLLIKDLEIFELKNTNKHHIRGWGYIRILCQNIMDYIS